MQETRTNETREDVFFETTLNLEVYGSKYEFKLNRWASDRFFKVFLRSNETRIKPMYSQSLWTNLIYELEKKFAIKVTGMGGPFEVEEYLKFDRMFFVFFNYTINNEPVSNKVLQVGSQTNPLTPEHY